MRQAGIRMTHVAYRSMAPAVTALLTGEVQVNFNSPLSALEHAKAGRIRPLGVTAPRRLASLPNVPTVGEAGLPGFVEGNWQGVLAPAATPRAIVVKLNQDFVRVVKSAEVSERIANAGGEVSVGTPEEFGNVVRADIAKYAQLVKAANIRPE